MTKNNLPSNRPLLSDDDIIAAARHLRDEENRRMNVRPWQPRYHAGWYVGVPAACLVGFLLGFYLRPSVEVAPVEQPVAHTEVRVDTVIVHQVVHDTFYQTTDPHRPVRPRPVMAAAKPAATPLKSEKIGVSMLEDGIRYDLLAASGRQ